MVIVKEGWKKGFRGRQQPARADRRMHYLASEHGRDSACLLSVEGKALSVEEAITAIGGKTATYHEVILAGSDSECETLRQRNPEDQQGAIRESGLRLAHDYAHGRPFVLAIHEGDGRFHFHIAVAGASKGQTMGRDGTLQQVWDREYFGDEPRILDWDSHKRFLTIKAQVRQVIQRQQENHRSRRDAIRRADPGRKTEVARPFEAKSRELIEQRYILEIAALDARYQARSSLDGPRHRSEKERVEHRRTGALHRLDRRESERRMRAIGMSLDQGIQMGGRQVGRTIGAVGQVTKVGVDSAMREFGVPRPLRATARITITLATEASRVALQTTMEAAKAAIQVSLRLTRGVSTLALGALAAPVTGGASLAMALPAARAELTAAGREASKGLARAGSGLVGSGQQAANAMGREILPFEASEMADLARGNAGRQFARHLPESLRRAMQLARILPSGSPLAVAVRLATETARAAQEASRPHLEVDR